MGVIKSTKKKIQKELERIRKELELEAADFGVEDNPNTYLLLLAVGEIRSLSGLILCFGLAIIGTIVAFGVVIISSI